jgi:hypothetical protein
MRTTVAETFAACASCRMGQQVMLLLAVLSCAGVAAATAPAGAGVDVRAVRAFLRTGAGFGGEVAVPVVGQATYFHIEYQLSGTTGSRAAEVRALIDGVVHCAGEIGSGARSGARMPGPRRRARTPSPGRSMSPMPSTRPTRPTIPRRPLGRRRVPIFRRCAPTCAARRAAAARWRRRRPDSRSTPTSTTG